MQDQHLSLPLMNAKDHFLIPSEESLGARIRHIQHMSDSTFQVIAVNDLLIEYPHSANLWILQ